jgi:hypothetical protein
MSAGVSTSTPSVLVFNDTDDFTSAWLNKAFASLDLRVRAIEGLNVSYTDAINVLNQFGLQRLNDAMQPVYDALINIAQLGAIFTTTSTSSVTLGLGTKTFVIAEANRTVFAAAAYISAVNSADATQVISGKTQSYDRTTGTLTLLADSFEGNAGDTVSNWTISAAVDFNPLQTYVDAALASLKAQLTGTADSSGDTLGELEAAIQAANAAIASLNSAVPQAQSDATTAATSNALALAIALG